jgi:hypothetical protein
MTSKRLLVYNAERQDRALAAGRHLYGIYGDFPPAIDHFGFTVFLEANKTPPPRPPRRNWVHVVHDIAILLGIVVGISISVLGVTLLVLAMAHRFNADQKEYPSQPWPTTAVECPVATGYCVGER